MFNKIRFWLNNARYVSLPQSVLPAILAVWIARTESDFSIICSILAIFGIACAHLGMNLLDDYFDYQKKGAQIRDHLAAAGFRARIAKCDYLTSGKTTMKSLFTAASVFLLLALACGTYILILRGLPILYITLITGILGVCYSGKPLRLSYRGLGEIVIAVIFGPCIMIGAYLAACGTITSSMIFISVPVGLWVGNIVYTHSIMDFQPDKSVGKMTLAVRINHQTGMLIVSSIFLFLPYIILTAGVVFFQLKITYLFVFLTLPLAISLFRLLIIFLKDPQRKMKPRFWMGPMEKWKDITDAGIEWFMIRWYSARNLLIFLCLIIFIVEIF